jgi:ubiquinone biosynthesis protein COQ4
MSEVNASDSRSSRSALPIGFEIPPPPPPQPRRWRRALRELRALLDDSDATEHAISFMLALGSGDYERNFQRVAASAQGRALLAERPSLLAALSDRLALAQLPEASLGRAYLAYLERNRFAPSGLLELQHRVQARWEREEGTPRLDPLREWFRDRSILVHDLFHLLTDYGTDDLGEATLLAFSLAQFGGAAQALLTAGAALECARALGWRFLAYDFRAWRRGRRAAPLVALPWEELLPLRLESVRRLAGVVAAEQAHPAGILRGHIVDGVAQ